MKRTTFIPLEDYLMNNTQPSHRLLLNLTAFVVCLPPLALLTLLPQVGIMTQLRVILNSERWFDLLILIFITGLYVTSLSLIFWKGRLLLAIEVFLLAFVVMSGYSQVFSDIGDERHQLGSLPARRTHSITINSIGIDVYCNDVYLGQTPLTISKRELRRKVKPWHQPPRQARHLGIENLTELQANPDKMIPRNQVALLYTPFNPLLATPVRRNWPVSGNKPAYFSYQEYRHALDFRYWLRFGKPGSSLLASIQPITWTYNYLNFQLRYDNPNFAFPTVDTHSRLVSHLLRHSGDEPSEALISYARKNPGIFDFLFRVAQGDSQLQNRISQIRREFIKAEFNIHDSMTEKEVMRVLDEVIARTAHKRTFFAPSVESIALELLGERVSKAVVKRAAQLASVAATDGCYMNSPHYNPNYLYGDFAWYDANSERAAQFLPLLYLMFRKPPPELFNRLVYEVSLSREAPLNPNRRNQPSYHRNPFLLLVAHYQREESVRLVRHHLSASFKAGRVSEAAEFMGNIYNPALEPDFQTAFNSLRSPGPISFFTKRISLPLNEDERNRLADGIFHHRTLEAEEKLGYLKMIDSAHTYQYMKALMAESPSEPRWLETIPNPALDQLYIEFYEDYRDSDGKEVRYENLPTTLFRCDTPKMQAYLDKRWNESAEERALLLRFMVQAQEKWWITVNLTRWAVPIGTLTEPSLRLLAIPVLLGIDTPEAGKILESWANSGDKEVSEAAGEAYAEYQERHRQAMDLIAGKIQPDDLLEPQTAYVWNGQDYVPETALNDR
jgi:hypothetical protein